jgi:hypothetical protein
MPRIGFGRLLLALLVGLALQLAGCSADSTSAEKEFIEETDTMREITAADCKQLRELEDPFMLM